jgi:hypothetical protein
MLCEWFALCDHEAVGYADHVIVGYVPICQRCADKLDIEIVLDLRTLEGVPSES